MSEDMSDGKRNVLLVNTPSVDKTINRDMAGGLGFSAGEGVVLPPLDLLIMAASLRTKGYNVVFVDAIAERIDDVGYFTGLCKTKQIDLVIGNMSLPTCKDDCVFYSRLKKETPSVKLVITTAISEPDIIEYILRESSAGMVIFTECDAVIPEYLEGGRTKGTARLIDGHISIVPQASSMPELDKVPIAARDLLKKDKYKYVLLPGSVTTMNASRGCPFPCAYYCPYPLVQGSKWRMLAPERVIEELISIKKLGFQSVFFRDAVFTLDMKRTARICDLMIQNGLDLNWWCETRINVLDEELLKKMRAAGCLGINVGIETLDKDMIQSQGKPGVKLSDVISIRKTAKDAGVRLHFLMIVGLPDENVGTLCSSFKYIKELMPETIGVTIITPYPGTPLYKEAIKDGLLSSSDWGMYNGVSANMHTKYLTESELRFGRFLLMSTSYFSRKPWIIRHAGFFTISVIFAIWKSVSRRTV